MFVTAPETPVHHHHPISSPKEIEARLLLLFEEREKRELISLPEFDVSKDDLQEDVKDEADDDEVDVKS